MHHPTRDIQKVANNKIGVSRMSPSMIQIDVENGGADSLLDKSLVRN